MKIRNGFVSNSSSSSFVLIGCDNSIIKKEIPKKIDNYEIGTLYIESKYDYVTGIILFDDEYLETIEYQNINELIEITKKLSEELDVPIEKMELIYGSRPS